ncbi:hypothetical protein [Limimaricola sp.]|uniref:hypothetical protein n=1 Tax=Limimaricola sp. TaxID=2211665 RepID=UPI004059352D
MAHNYELKRQADNEGFYLNFTGGFRAANIYGDSWQIEPVLIGNKPCATGPLTMSQLKEVVAQKDLRAVAFHRFGWVNGEYYTSWAPIVLGKGNHSEGPADLWNNIAGNISRPRVKELFSKIERPTGADVAKALDDRNPVEALAQHIGLSLRSMDISVEQIADHYHEQLVNHMAAGRVNGERSANTLSQTLFAHVHSFFLHLGAARDYLGALIAYRIGLDPERIDSMARLVSELRQAKLAADALLELLFRGGNITTHPEKTNRFAVSGWMQDVTSLRNQLVHKRPYGSKSSEHSGWVVPVNKEAGLYRYFRPLEIEGDSNRDVFDVLHYHYAKCTDLFHMAAKASGNNAEMMRITDADIISRGL